MANGVLGYGDLIAGATISSTGTTGNMIADNVRTQQLGIVAELASTTGSVAAVLPAAAPARLFVVYAPGALATDSFTLLASTTTDPSLGDIANTVLPPVDPAVGLTFFLAAVEANLRSQRITCDCATAPRIGRLWSGPVLQPEYNYALGYSEGGESGSVNAFAVRSGARYSDRRYQKRVIEVQHEYLAGDEAERARLASIALDTVGQAVWIPDPAAADAVTRMLIGHQREIDPIVLPQLVFGADGRPMTSKRWRITEDR